MHCTWPTARYGAICCYDMPVQYAPGVLKEHLHTRAAAGLFDVSHMARSRYGPSPGNWKMLRGLSKALVPVDILG